MKAMMAVGEIFLIGILLLGCSTPDDNPQIDVSDMTIETVVVPANFNYSTSKNVEIMLTAPEVLNGAVFQLYTLKNGIQELDFGKGTFGSSGQFNGVYTVNSLIDSIRVVSGYLGLINQVDIPIIGNKATFDYKPLYTSTKSAFVPQINVLKSASADPFTYLATYNSSGVPSNLIAPDVFQKDFYDDINASLPEYKPVPKSHPEYLAGKESSIVLTKTADVWVTFVTEGAGWRNALGYYTNTNKELKIIFPNVSMSGSGGALKPGSKVYLGKFQANTTISWFLVSNGWNGTQVVAGNGTQYSDPEMNVESDVALRQHMVLLYDKARSLMMMGFEDIPRNLSNCDNDFNDAIFFATANPVDAVATAKLASITAANDSDGDGINDAIDDFPYDANKAFNNYSPSTNANGTLAFEDLWPSLGDFDFNDLVLEYNFNQIANAQNMISSLEATFTVKNIGGSFKNGFGFVLPINPSKVKSVENQVLNAGYAKVSSNGTESGQINSVIFVIENAQVKVGTKIPIVINFTTPISTNELGGVPYNPFIVVNGDRTKEVHLADMVPTDLGKTFLGQNDDYSNALAGRYYKTNRNLPWALNIFDTFAPSSEKVSIDKTYSRFISWANSGGTKDLDWYKK